MQMRIFRAHLIIKVSFLDRTDQQWGVCIIYESKYFPSVLDGWTICWFLAPVDLSFKPLSTTSVKTIVIPPENSTAKFYEVGVENPLLGNYQRAYFGSPEGSGISFRHLVPGITYKFWYRLGLRGDWYDINSESRSKVLTMPYVGTCVCPYKFQMFTFVKLFPYVRLLFIDILMNIFYYIHTPYNTNSWECTACTFSYPNWTE